MTRIDSLPIATWDHRCSTAEQEHALRTLENGNVLLFPRLPFPLEGAEDRLMSQAIAAASSKNVSLDPSTGKLRGSTAGEADLILLRNMMQRFSASSATLLRDLLPRYNSGLLRGRTSFRPVEITSRSISWRKDDTRLHVDSFPSTPVRDKRILRIFSNVNPQGQSRTWRLGESFEIVARRYMPSLPRPVWGVSPLLKTLHITKGRRSAYDHFMLRLHDRMKSDPGYQMEAGVIVHEFEAGSTWMAFTDEVSHAAMRGQYALEQTYYVPITYMHDPSHSPLRILERLAGRALT
jgi:hypothetical protein